MIERSNLKENQNRYTIDIWVSKNPNFHIKSIAYMQNHNLKLYRMRILAGKRDNLNEWEFEIFGIPIKRKHKV